MEACARSAHMGIELACKFGPKRFKHIHQSSLFESLGGEPPFKLGSKRKTYGAPGKRHWRVEEMDQRTRKHTFAEESRPARGRKENVSRIANHHASHKGHDGQAGQAANKHFQLPRCEHKV
eukprot:644216-Pelagomonas_calceolata.AAC.1